MLSMKDTAREWAYFKIKLKELENDDKMRFTPTTLENDSGIMLSTNNFLELQNDTCAEVEFSKRYGSQNEYPLRAEFKFEGTIFYTIITPLDIKKMKEMGFEVNVK